MQLLTSPPIIFTALLLSAVGLLAAVVALVKLRRLSQLKAIFLAGKNGADLETILYALVGQLHNLEDQQVLHEQLLADIQHRLGFTVQKVGVVRFNPFSDGGGNFSFSIALLNAHDSGIVITSMHGREQNRIYTKKIEQGKSESPLTEEEYRALAEANERPGTATQKNKSRAG